MKTKTVKILAKDLKVGMTVVAPFIDDHEQPKFQLVEMDVANTTFLGKNSLTGQERGFYRFVFQFLSGEKGKFVLLLPLDYEFEVEVEEEKKTMKTVIYYTQHAPTDGQIEFFLQRGFDQVLHPAELVATPFTDVGDAINRLKQFLAENEQKDQIELAAIVAVLPVNMLNPFIKAFPVPVLRAVMEKVGQPATYEWTGKFTRTVRVEVVEEPFNPTVDLPTEVKPQD